MTGLVPKLMETLKVAEFTQPKAVVSVRVTDTLPAVVQFTSTETDQTIFAPDAGVV